MAAPTNSGSGILTGGLRLTTTAPPKSRSTHRIDDLDAGHSRPLTPARFVSIAGPHLFWDFPARHRFADLGLSGRSPPHSGTVCLPLSRSMPTSSKNRRESNKNNRSQRNNQRTDRLLNSVEQLIALHDQQPAAPADLSERLERLESQLARLLDQPESKESGPSIEAVLKQVEGALEKRFQTTEKRLAGHFAKQLKSLQPETPPEWLQEPLEKLQQQHQSLQEQLELLGLHWEEARAGVSPRAESADGETTDLTSAIEHLKQQFDQLQPTLESLAGATNQSSDESSWEEAQAKWQEQWDASKESWSETLQHSLDEQLESVREQLAELSESFAQSTANSDSSSDDAQPAAGSTGELLAKFADQVNLRTSKLLDSFRKELADSRPASQPAAPAATSTPASPNLAPSDDSQAASHWERQKEAMLAKYGIDPNYRQADAAKPATEEPVEIESEVDDATKKLESLHASIDKIAPEDHQDIEKLKDELNSKLRDAEVELSIARAKLSRERAELDEARTELKQRTQELEAKLAKVGDGTPKGGFISRLGRHLGGERPE